MINQRETSEIWMLAKKSDGKRLFCRRYTENLTHLRSTSCGLVRVMCVKLVRAQDACLRISIYERLLESVGVVVTSTNRNDDKCRNEFHYLS